MTDQSRQITVSHELVEPLPIKRILAIDQRLAAVARRVPLNFVIAVPNRIGRPAHLFDKESASFGWHHAETVFVDKQVKRGIRDRADFE